MNEIRTGKSKDHTNRKNPRSREVWIKEKRADRGAQSHVSDTVHAGVPFGQPGSFGRTRAKKV